MREKREAFRNAIIKQLYSNEGEHSCDIRYLAFLLVKRGRGGEIVGNPYIMGKGGSKQELPYTGLEGYYAGWKNVKTSWHDLRRNRPGGGNDRRRAAEIHQKAYY